MWWNKHQRLLVFLTCFLAIATVHADVYKWVDDQGKVHYSDAPPRGAASQKIEIPMSAPPQGENAEEHVYLEDKDRPAEIERLKKEIAIYRASKDGERKFPGRTGGAISARCLQFF
jgi:hypothetical protein